MNYSPGTCVPFDLTMCMLDISSAVGLRFFICLLLLCKLLLCSHRVNLASQSLGTFWYKFNVQMYWECVAESVSCDSFAAIFWGEGEKWTNLVVWFYFISFDSDFQSLEGSNWQTFQSMFECSGSLGRCPSILAAAIYYRGMACGWFFLIFCSPALAKSSLPFQGSASVKGTEIKLPKTTSPAIKKRMKQHFLDSDSSLHSKHAQLYLQSYYHNKHSSTGQFFASKQESHNLINDFPPLHLQRAGRNTEPWGVLLELSGRIHCWRLRSFLGNLLMYYRETGCQRDPLNLRVFWWSIQIYPALCWSCQVPKVWKLARNDVTNCIHLHSIFP